MQLTSIEWSEASWNPVRGCSKVSAGCKFCYAEKIASRFSSSGGMGVPGTEPTIADAFHGFATKRGWTGRVELIESKLTEPLRWKKPRRIFVNSMSDLFHESLSDEAIDKVFAVMALATHHQFLVLTKRAKRMREWASDTRTPGRVARAADVIAVALETAQMGPEDIRPITSYPGYFVSDRGRILSSSGSAHCMFCGGSVEGIATRMYCSKKCRQNACYYRRVGRPVEMEKALTEMSPDPGDQGYLRVMLYREGEQYRELVHRLVLTYFNRPPENGEQVCHRDGNPTNNVLPNLRWGDQPDNWIDRKRHSNGTMWPLSNIWKGVSAEDQATADERIPDLLATPAAVRWVSAEPLLGPVDFDGDSYDENRGWLRGWHCEPEMGYDAYGQPEPVPTQVQNHRLDWIVVGGESGPGARPFDLAWARRIIADCKVAGVPVFMKQLGREPVFPCERCDGKGYHHGFGEHGVDPDWCSVCGGGGKSFNELRDRKGGEMTEWPEDLRVREFPK